MRSPADSVVVKRLWEFNPLLATVIEVAPAIASAVRGVYSFTTVFAAVTVLAPFYPRCPNETNEIGIKKKIMRSFNFNIIKII